MAQDLVEVLDHAGWTSPRQVHAVGLSLGGMIAQELGLLIPDRIATLNLIHTTARIESTWMDYVKTYGQILKKKTVDETLWAAASAMFSHDWLLQPDNAEVPDISMPGVRPPQVNNEGGSDSTGETSHVYLKFDNNYARYAAQELTKQNDPLFMAADKWAVLGHFLASSTHYLSDARLVQLADAVGRDRILVLHASEDNMIPSRYGAHLMAVLRPGRAVMRQGSGHVPKLERARWFNELLAETFTSHKASEQNRIS
jgi:pimeloyl-ACP methyl ester carboxylesterase